MSSQNNEFEIPFSQSRRGKKEEINVKAIGRRIGSSAASRLVDRPNIGGRRRRGTRGLGIPDGDLNPRTRVDVDGDGTIFDGWPGWEQPDPTPSSMPNAPKLSLSSGEKDKKPSFPRKPTYGPFIGSAEDRFGKAKTWEEFKEIYDDTEINFFDYETTGLVFDEFREPSANGQPVQFGVVRMKGDKEIARLNLFMNPKEPLGEWSARELKDRDGNQLTDEWLSRQMSMAEAHRALVEFAGEDAIFGVQNAAFDKDVLEQTLSDAGIEWRPGGYLDTKDIADMTLPKWSEENQDGPFVIDSEGNKKPSNGLAAITKYLEVELGEKHHTADADAQATGLVMSAIINGAIERDWPTNLLDSEKRKTKLQKDNEKFDAEIKKFRAAKEEFIKAAKQNEQPSLSSGSKERPIIKLENDKKRPVISFQKDERELLKKHRSTKYKYGDKSALGGEIKSTKTNWLKGLSSEQISELIVPSSQEEHYRMWVDDIAPGAYETPSINEAFRKYYDEMMAGNPWDEVDYSPDNVQASRDAVKALLDSSPAVKWAFENHGAPSIGVMSAKGIETYEAIPSVSQKLTALQNERFLAKKPFVRARLSPGTNLLIFNKRALIDREGSIPGEETPLLWSDAHMPLITDAHIDKSITGTIVHEWGHWLVFRAVKDTEQIKRNRTNFFGSGDLNDDNYIKALALSEYYSKTEKNNGLMDLWNKKVPIEDSREVPRVLTSYGHVNEAETFAEGVVAYFHPNPEVRKNAINEKLRNDIETFLGDGDGKKPWDDNESIELAISSGRTSKQRLEKREANSTSSEQAFSSMPEDDRELARLDYFLSLSSGAIIPESGSRKLEIINDFDDRKNDNFATPIRVVSFKDSNGKDVEYTIFATGKFGDSVYVFEKTKLDKYVSEKEEMISLANGVPFEEVGISVISTMTDEREIRDKKNGLVGVMSVMPPSGDGETSVVHEIAIDDKHKRRGLASALFKYHRDSWPDQDLHHSSALSDDGRAFAAATPFDGTSNPPVGNLQNDLTNFVRGLMEVLPDDENDNDISLSSGAKYSEIVKRQPNPSREQIDSSRNFKDFVQLDELRKEDVWATTGVDDFGDDITEMVDSEDRANIKKDIKQSIETLFSYEIELDDSIVVTSNSGEKINLGNRIKITAVVEDVQVSALEEKDISEQINEIGHMLIGEDKKPLTRVDVKFKISPADSAATEKLLALGVPESLIDIDNPKTDIELGRAHRAIFTDGSKTIVSHESIFISNSARGNGLASVFNARNESLYREIDADSIITQGMSSSSSDQIGATHWARNGFTILGEPSKQRFIGVIDDAITNKPGSFSEEERKRISSLYKKDKKTGKFTSSATPEELIDFSEADEVFGLSNNGDGEAIFFTREVSKPSGINKAMNRMRRRVGSERTESISPSLSSGAFDYRGLHGAPGRGSGAPLHDLISPDYSVYPEDVYSSNAIKYYGVGDDNLDASAFNLIRSFKGKPNAEVTIYRAVPTSPETRISRLEKEKAHIMKYGKVPKSAVTNLGPSEYYEKISNEIDELKNNPEVRSSVSSGDWVTPFRQYAVMHGDGALRGDYEIVKKRVKAKNVYTDGNSWLEWGYDDSKGSLSLSSGEQPKINLSDDEKREIIRLASQRTDSFSRSVVAQYHRNNGRLSNKQWASLNRMTSRGALGLGSGMVSDGEILTRVAKSFERASLPDEPSTPIDQRLISKMVSGLKKKDGTPVSINDFLGFLSKIADINDDRLGNHPGFNDLEETILPIESLADIFKELGHSRIDVPGSRTKKILGPVVREMVDLVGDDEFLEDARQYALPPLEVWARAAAKSILQMQEFTKDVGEPRREFMKREFSIESLDGVNSFVLRDIGGEIIMSGPVSDMQQRDRHEFQYSNLNSIMFSYHQQTPGIPFMTMVKRHLYPDDPLAEVLADRRVMSANNDAAMGGRNMAESLENAILTPLDVYKFSDSPSGRRVREMFERAYTDVAHYDEFSRRYATRVRKLVSDAGLDPDSPEVKRALTTGWTQVADSTEEPPENGGRFISAALLVRNLVAGLYRPSWDMSGEAYTTPHEFMHLITGQGFTRHGEMASNIGWLGAFGKDVWPKVATLLGVQARFFDLQKEDSAGGDLIEGNEQFRVLVMNEIKELLGGDGDDYGRTSQALLEKLYEEGGILRTAKTDGLFEGFNWIDPLLPLEASDLGWGLKFGQPKDDEGLSLSSGALNRKPTKKNIADGKKILERLKNESDFSENGESLDNMYARGAVVSSEKIVNAENRDIARDIVLDAERNMNSWKAEEESARNSGMAGYVYEAEGMRDGASQTFTAMYGPLTTVTEYRRENRRNERSSSPSLSSGAEPSRYVVDPYAGFNHRLNQTKKFADPEEELNKVRELYAKYRDRSIPWTTGPEIEDESAMSRAVNEVMGEGVVPDWDGVRAFADAKRKRIKEDKEFIEELKQEHIRRFGYSFTEIPGKKKAAIEIYDDELAYNSLNDLSFEIGKGKNGETKTRNEIKKIQEQLEKLNYDKGGEFVLEDGPDGFKYYLKKLDMSYIEEENNERLRLIEKYKSEGLTAIEATMRAWDDIRDDERFSWEKRYAKITEDEQ